MGAAVVLGTADLVPAVAATPGLLLLVDPQAAIPIATPTTSTAGDRLIRPDTDIYRLCFLRGPEGVSIGLA